ncbi:ATR-interacting protein-like isoform X2 [Liolophura sinensis]|uniref:ATR-interacting protein-like isoform X2 n=1 Tax=Liolophura sinensis TaxID=3198878 RepID=UPI0031583502
MKTPLFLMNQPPDKKRKTSPCGQGKGKTVEENPWGEDFTEDELEFFNSQADSQSVFTKPELPTCPPDVSAAVSPEDAASQSKTHVQEPVASSSKDQGSSQQVATSSTSSKPGPSGGKKFRWFRQKIGGGQRLGSADDPLGPSKEFPEDLQRCLLERERQIADFQAQLFRMEDELTAREGEVAIQRETIQQKETEILKYKQEKMGQVEADKRERSAKERQLELEVERLGSQVQFKEREVSEVVNKCRALEMKIAQLEGAGTSPVKLSTHSPRVHPVGKKSPLKSPQSAGYPTIESFQAKNPQDSTDKTDTSTENVSIVEDDKAKRKQRLPTTISKGVVGGPYLVSRLLGEVGNLHIDSIPTAGGIVRLLLPRGRTPVNLSTVYLEREGGSLLFSPKHLKRSTGFQRSMSTSRSLAYRDSDGKSSGENAARNIALANIGVSAMLTGEYSPKDLGRFIQSISDEDIDENVLTHEAVFLLPLIEDCVREYSKMLNVCSDDNLSSPKTSLSSLCFESGSSSDRSSFHSFSSSLSSLLREGATYANSLEEITLAALHVLHELVSHCPEVVSWIFSESRPSPVKKSQGSSSAVTGAQGGAKEEEPTAGTSKMSSKLPDSVPKSSPSLDGSALSDLQILYYIITLADTGMDNGLLHRQAVVERCLDILYKLAAQCSSKQKECLSPLVSLGVLHTCLGPDTPTPIVKRALRVLTQLVQCNSLLGSLCSASDGCIWMCVYGLCTNKKSNLYSERNVIFTNVIQCWSAVAANTSRQGISKLVDSGCVCSNEVIKAVTMLMGNVLEEYLRTNNKSKLELIKMGLPFMQLLCQNDSHLADRQDDTVHNYVALVCRLTELYKQLPGITVHESVALHELWEMLQEEGSGDSQMECVCEDS